MNDEGLRIDVGPAERSIADWERRYEAGAVPGRWPYGLDALSGFARVRAIDLPQPGRLTRAWARLGRFRRPVRDAVGLTWDENAALRMAQTRPHARHLSGVIWLTDAAVRRRPLGRLPDTLDACSGLWVLSDAQVEPLRRLVPHPTIEYVRFGIDDRFFSERDYPRTPRVVSVGGDRDRDTRTLFEAFAQIHAARPEVELIVQTASNLSPPVGVTVIRHLPHTELRELFASASVVAIATHPNLHVSGMTVSLEAMATGRPVAITRTPGMSDYVADGETGLLSEPGAPDALADNVIQLLADPDRARALGRAGRRAVEGRFTSVSMAASIAELGRATS